MKIAVIGAGMAGVAAAQALASDGHDVTVIERRSSVAEETSFAPAGVAAAGLAAPWLPAAGRLQAMAGGADEANRLRGIGAAFGVPTLFGKGDGPDAARRAERALALHRLLATGVQRIDALAHGLSLDFERGDGLLLTLPDDAAAAAQAEVAVAWLQQAGEPVEWVDAARQRQIEPGRDVADDAPRAVHLPGARTGNTREWTQLLRAHAQHLGVRFLFQHEVAAISAGPHPVVQLGAAGEAPREAAFDAVVVCAALESARLLAPLGVKLPWKPIRGYSVTVAQHVREAARRTAGRAPRCSMCAAASPSAGSAPACAWPVAMSRRRPRRPSRPPRRPRRRRCSRCTTPSTPPFQVRSTGSRRRSGKPRGPRSPTRCRRSAPAACRASGSTWGMRITAGR